MENAILFQPTGEVREAKPEEWYHFHGDIRQNMFVTETFYKYPIYTRHEIPAEMAKRMMEEAKP
jgi:hypothetical protein